MRWKIVMLAAMSLAAFSAPMAQAEYYYSSGNKIPLIVKTS